MRLEELEFARVMPLVCLLPPASTMFASELSESRLAYAMENILVTVVDDMFDVGGSMEEMDNFITLIDKYQNSHAHALHMMHHFVPTDRQMSINYIYLYIYKSVVVGGTRTKKLASAPRAWRLFSAPSTTPATSSESRPRQCRTAASSTTSSSSYVSFDRDHFS